MSMLAIEGCLLYDCRFVQDGANETRAEMKLATIIDTTTNLPGKDQGGMY